MTIRSEITTKNSAAVGEAAGTGSPLYDYPCLAADWPLSGPQDTVLVGPNRRTAVVGASRDGRSARLADDQRDVTFGAALVTAVTGVGGHHPGPQLRLLLR